MANLLRWSFGLSLPKKKEEETAKPLITSLRTMNPIATRSNTTNNTQNNVFSRVQQMNDQIRQQAEQRRQQEEQQRQQRIAEQQRQQEQRKQQEQAKRLAEQRLQEQKQRNLLNSAGLGNSGFGTTDLRSNLEARKQAIAKRQQETITNKEQQQQEEAEKQRQLNENETNRLINTYTKRLERNREILNRFRAGEKLPGQLNAFGDYTELGLTNNFGKEAPLKVKTGLPLAEKQLENRVKEDEKALEMVKKGAKPITLAHGLRVVGDELSQVAGNAIFGEATEDENPLKKIARTIANVPLSMVGSPLGVPDLIGNAVNPYGTRNEIQKNSDGTASVNTKENTALTRIGSGADAALRLWDSLSGGEKEIITSLAGKGAKASLLNTLKNMGKTALEEGIQESAENLAEELADQGKWDEGTIGRTVESGLLGAATGGAMAGISSGINGVRQRIANKINTNANTNENINTNVNLDENINENTNVDTSNVQTTQDGTMVKTNVDGTATKLSDAELANVVEQRSAQPSTVKGLNPFIENSVKLGTSEDLNTLAKRAEQGDTYAQERLAELTGQNEEENTGWQGKSVEDVINPENETNVAQEKRIYHGTPNVFEDFDENLPSVWFTNNKDTIADTGLSWNGKDKLNVMERILPENLKLADWDTADRLTQQQMIDRGYDGVIYDEGDGSDVYYEIFDPNRTLKKVNNQVEIKNAEDYDETPEILPSERAINDQEDAEAEELRNALGELYGQIEENTQVAPSYDEDLSMQKINDVVEGKTSFEDYIGDQRELLWKSFKDSNRGNVESFLVQDPESNDYQRRVTTTENGTLYRQLYQEYGGKPTKENFNEALDDVLINGKDSKYYDGFREFDHDGERSIFGFNQGNENIDLILDLRDDMGAQQSIASRIKNEVQNIKDGAAALGQMLTGQNRLQPAYAGADGDYARIDDNTRTINDIDTTKSFSTYVGDGGKIAVRIDNPMLLENANVSEYKKIIKNAIVNAFGGESLDIGDTGMSALVSNRTADKISNRGGTDGTDSAYKIKGNMAAQLDEIVNNLHNVRFEENKYKNDIGKKNKIKQVIKGEIEVDVNGKKIYPTVVIREYNNGQRVIHEITGINRTATYLGWNDFSLSDGSSSSNTSSISQNNANVKNKSQFAENTSANKNFSTETRSDLKSDPLTYKPTSNEERLTRANEILSTKSFDEIDNYLRENFFNVKPKDADSADMVLAGEYAKMLDAKGQFDRSTEIINRMSEIGTKQGQNIQALYLMMNRSPEGIANMAQNAIKKGGGEMTPELRRQIVEKTQEIGRTRSERAKLADENAKISGQIMSGKSDLDSLRKRQMQIAQSYRLQLDQEGRQFSRLSDIVGKNSPDKRFLFGSIWRAGLLSGPRTHTGNAVSNTFQNVINAGADRFASGLDWARSKVTGTERQVVASAGGRGKGIKRGLKAAAEVMKTGDNLWDSTDMVTGKETAWGQGGELEFKNKIANTMLAKPTNFVFRAMSAGDLPFRYAAFENAIRTEAKRQGVNQGYKGQALQDYINSRVATPDPELQAYGIRKGNEAVYDVDTMLSDVMTRIDKLIDGQENKVIRNGLKLGKTLVAPFVKIPSKVLSTAVDYSHLGAVKAIVKKVGSSNYTTAQFETDLAKSGLGSVGFVGLGYALSAAGLLTGGYPSDDKERDKWRAEGVEPNSIKIGDKYVSMNYLGPMSILTAIGAGVQQRQAKGEDALTIARGTLTDTLNSFLNQSYVQGLNNALNAVTDSQRYGESFWNSLARGVTPNLLRQTATATDPKQRQVNNPGEAIISGVPGLSQTLDPKVDVYGREIENKQTLPLGQMWDALKISNSRETNDVIDEVKRLHNIDPNNKDLQVTPPTQDNNISVNGTNIKLTDAQKTQLQKDTGEAAIAAMRQVMQSEKYASLSDEQKAKALDKARSEAQTQARKQFIEANNITPENNPETKNSGGSVTGNYASKAITGATSTRQNGKLVANDSISQESKSIIDKYNSMDNEDWDKYLYGTTVESAAAEYNLAKAKYENDLANDKLTEPQKIKREKELAKLEVSQRWTKDYRDAYSLAGTKADMQAYLGTLDKDTRAKTVATLNGLNNAMYEAGIISKSTYSTRYNAINNTTSKKSGSRKSSRTKSEGISSAEASALASLAKTMAKGDDNVKIKTPEAPNTNRKVTRSKSGGNSTGIKTYAPSSAKKITVTKGKNKSIA